VDPVSDTQLLRKNLVAPGIEPGTSGSVGRTTEEVLISYSNGKNNKYSETTVVKLIYI
jgi:hypothetical protein